MSALYAALHSLIGIAWGLAVGGGLVALLVVLDVIPRLAQLTRTYRHVRLFEGAVICGAVFWTATDFFHLGFQFISLGAAFVGLLAGCFVGMLAAALTEVLNVLPILAKRVRMGNYLAWLVLAMIMGKIVGSLFDWLLFRA